MKIAKKLAAMLCILSLGLSLASCDQSKPDAVVDAFCKAAQEMDVPAMAAQIKSPASERFLKEMSVAVEMMGPMADALKKHTANMTYTITDSTITDNSAIVTVEIVMDDLGAVVQQALENFLPGIIDQFAGGQRPSEEDILAQLLEDLAQADTQAEVGTITASVSFDCIKTEKDGWKISNIDNDALSAALRQNLNSGDVQLEQALREQILQNILGELSGSIAQSD